VKRTCIQVDGLCCATEEQSIRRTLDRPGIGSLSFDLVSKKVTVDHSVQEADLLQSLRSIGLPGRIIDQTRPAPARKANARHWISTLSSGAFLLIGLALTWMDFPPLVPALAFAVSIASGGWNVAYRAWLSVRRFALDMNVLMTVAVAGAVATGNTAEGAAVIFLFALSLLLESMSIDRSRRAIESLMRLSPSVAIVVDETGEREVPVDDVEIGQRVMVRPGDRIPLDGVVNRGTSTADESSLTGESLPVPKRPGEVVFAGTMNQRGSLEIGVTKRASDSTLAHIVHLVEEAQSKKAPVQYFVERFARYYTPTVFLLAIAVAALPPLVFGFPFGEWFYRALVLLVIACPCALVISTPVSIVSAVTNAARHGVLIKGGRYLETLATVKAVALDKTGTLTEARLRVTDIVPLSSLTAREILGIATVAERNSEHHVASAILEKASEENVDGSGLTVDHFESLPGKGIEAVVGGTRYIVGNHQLTEERGLCSPGVERILASLEAEGKTCVIVSRHDEALGVLGISDTIREHSRGMVRSLNDLGIEHVGLLTGDTAGSAAALKEALQVHSAEAELTPEDKLIRIRELRQKHGPVAMVGDGVNDAPALAAADIGIAMGAAGSDTALETADVVLMSDDLRKLPFTIRLGRKASAVIRQNVTIAIVTKAVFLILAILGWSSLWLAILADDGATLVVILNSLRLLRENSVTQ